MGCGCGRNKKKRMQSSRMPVTETLNIRKKKNCSQRQPINKNASTTNDQRRSAVAKARNAKIMRDRKNG
tara:strand:- start:661 stop:867 length:207 start_codon:yes stop_codon:yes gene_type:complete